MKRSDFIILLIAMHTLLSITRPGKSLGLHNYRHTAYACWGVVSILLPCLAFVNPVKHEAYISQGAYCYLPVRPIWYRLALGWIPRYLILCAIVSIYVAIYIYVTMQFGKFDLNLTSSTLSATPEASDGIRGGAAVPTRTSGSSYRYRRSKERPHRRLEERQPPTGDDQSAGIDNDSGQQGPLKSSQDRIDRKPTLLEALRDKSLLPPNRDGGPLDANRALRNRHKAIQRQLRYMFIYPLVYLLMWIAPFINHCYYYTKQHNPPFLLNCITLICLCLQCAVDCLVFGIRERPWRSSSKGSSAPGGKQSGGNGSGAEMIELVERNERADNPDSSLEADNNQHLQSYTRQQPRKERNWWDEEPM